MPSTNNIATNTVFTRFYNPGGMGYVQEGGQKDNQPSAYSWQSTSTTRYYASDTEREISNGKTTDYTYITSPNGLVAAVKTSGSKHDVMLLATDHLGSIIGVWNASGTLLEEYRSSALNLRPLTAKVKRRARPWGHRWARC